MRELSTSLEAEDWLLEAETGDRAVYFKGASLAEARSVSDQLDELATYLFEHSNVGELVQMSESGHPRLKVVTSGEVRLSQTREEPGGAFFYVAEMC